MDVREAAARIAEGWIGGGGLVDEWAAYCHDQACKMIAQDIRALPAPEVTEAQFEAARYAYMQGMGVSHEDCLRAALTAALHPGRAE